MFKGNTSTELVRFFKLFWERLNAYLYNSYSEQVTEVFNWKNVPHESKKVKLVIETLNCMLNNNRYLLIEERKWWNATSVKFVVRAKLRSCNKFQTSCISLVHPLYPRS